MNETAGALMIVLGFIALAALSGLKRARRRVVDLELELIISKRLLKRYREHFARVNKLLRDMNITNIVTLAEEEQARSELEGKGGHEETEQAQADEVAGGEPGASGAP